MPGAMSSEKGAESLKSSLTEKGEGTVLSGRVATATQKHFYVQICRPLTHRNIVQVKSADMVYTFAETEC
jgi:hypothetical protein